ncbi:hypothetical protein SDC9_168103 [bioreactor metagenome]|uniref:Glycoside hydrolase family 65 C-terminal domain-containing protein n=1 Tax=bioreactor metagenome TaxID=1076179 RepID=A0A645G9H6_9ZZZZ
MFGIRPVGLKSFTLTPRLPAEWDQMALRRIHAFNTVFDIEVKRIPQNRLQVEIIQNGKTKTLTVKESETIKFTLK